MQPEPRRELSALIPVFHGGAAPATMIDFSTGVSPLPPPAPILRAIADADVTRYPDSTARPLRERLAALHAVEPEQVVIGAGSVELIWALARAFAGPGRRGLVLGPCFGEYAQALRASGARCLELRPPAPFAVDVTAAEHAAHLSSIAFMCRPGNPTLRHEPPALIDALAARSPSTLWVIDEAYASMFDDLAPVPVRTNVLLLRSLTKLFALPGLRLGYLVASLPVARAVQLSLPPWNVSAPAQAAGLAACESAAEIPAIRRELAGLRQRLVERLGSERLVAQGGPFLLYRVGDAASFTRALDAAGCRVRDCTSFGLPEHVRVGVRPPADQDVLASAWPRA
jgi:histidinol-phosphate/aromatic aminotransferase/cobyric acid decarboxylase-like protein